MSYILDNNDKITANEALDLLPGIFQSIGRIKEEIHKAKTKETTSKLWNKYDELNNEGACLMSIIRLKVNS